MENENQESVELQDPLHNLSLPGTYHMLPNPIWLQLLCLVGAKAKLYSYICRRTIGFMSKKTKVYRVAMPWPGNEEVSSSIGIKGRNNLSTARKQLERGKMIFVWKERGTRKEWVGINPAMLRLSPVSARFLAENCGRIDFTKEGSEEEIKKEIRREIERKNLGAEESEILDSEVLNLRFMNLIFQTLESKILYSNLEGYLYTFPDDSKVPEKVEPLNKTLYNKMLDRERTSASQKKGKGEGEAKTTLASQKEKSPASNKGSDNNGEKVELIEFLIAAHKKHCKSGGKWLTPGYKPEVNEQDKTQGFPKAAKSILTDLSGLKCSLAGLADRYVKFVVKIGCERGWPDPPNGANYSDSVLIDQFFREDEIILAARKSERRKAEALRKQKEKEEWEKEEKERERKKEKELERIKEVFDTGERPCLGNLGKYEDFCEKCKEKTEEEWYLCRLKSGGKARSLIK